MILYVYAQESSPGEHVHICTHEHLETLLKESNFSLFHGQGYQTQSPIFSFFLQRPNPLPQTVAEI